tara:strand:- start:334 stop:573 length:240 start_codon:yes stop_codon:yes gene_type:complete
VDRRNKEKQKKCETSLKESLNLEVVFLGEVQYTIEKLKKTILYDHVCHVMKILKVKVFIIEFAIYVRALKNGKWVMITQ